MYVCGGYETPSHVIPWELSTPSETKILAALELTKFSRAAQMLQSPSYFYLPRIGITSENHHTQYFYMALRMKPRNRCLPTGTILSAHKGASCNLDSEHIAPSCPTNPVPFSHPLP